MNARFWVYVNGSWTKLTLRPGQSLSCYHSGPADEGWGSEWNKWSFEEQEGEFHAVVQWEWCSDGRDCDGRHSAGGMLVCELRDLKARDLADIGGPAAPEWQTADRYQRDYSAEAAGY